MSSITTRRGFDKALGLIERHLKEKGISTTTDFNKYVAWEGVTSSSIDLAILSLIRANKIEALYTLPVGKRGNRKTYYALTEELDKGQLLPPNTIRVKDALNEIETENNVLETKSNIKENAHSLEMIKELV